MIDVERQEEQLKTLILLGKERGFLTCAEINDHLPSVVDAEPFQSITVTFNDLGIEVRDAS